MSSRLYLTLAASLALVGCDQLNKDSAQTDTASNPNYKQAQQDLDNNNPSGAIADYEAALAANPKLAKAHYELGVLYGDKMNDPVSSIYHFKRFIELSPDSDKKDQVQALIDKESTVFAASLPNSPAQNSEDYAKLQSENASLKKQVDDATATITKLQTQIGKHHHDLAATTAPAAADTATPAAAPDASQLAASGDASAVTPAPAAASTDGTTTPATTTPAAPAAVNADTQAIGTNGVPVPTNPTTGTSSAPANPADARSYKVVAGDSYWKIAKKMYPGDTKNGVAKIQEANKNTVGKPLKIGQVLVIP